PPRALHSVPTRRSSDLHNWSVDEKAEGAEAVKAHVSEIMRNWPDIQFRSRRLYAREGLVVSEWTASATREDGVRIEWDGIDVFRSEEHTSELQSLTNLV